MSVNMYCFDANIFLEGSKNRRYPQEIFMSLWAAIANEKHNIIIIQPIYDEIEPISYTDKSKPKKERQTKYPIKCWLEDNEFDAKPITDDVEEKAFNMMQNYQTAKESKGASEEDIRLIAYAKTYTYKLVTNETKQNKDDARSKTNYKIPS